MRNRTIRTLVILGLLAVFGTFSVQYYLLRTAFNEESKKFNQTVHIALLDVVKKLYDNEVNRMPQINPVRQPDSDYFVVDLNDNIEAEILEYYLKSVFEEYNLMADFEYAIYDCETDLMVYGNYISRDDRASHADKERYLPKYEGLNYYFGIRFPNKTGYLVGSMEVWIVFTLVLVFVMFFFAYSVFIVLQQKRYSELQQDFINNMTHEFKTPIASTRIALEYLGSTPEITSESRLAKYTEIMKLQNERLNSQVESILQISRTEIKQFEINTSSVDLVSILESIIKSINIEGSNGEISLKTKSNVANTLADELHLTNLFYCLIDNALKYSPETPDIHISLIDNKNNWVVKVEDKGIGIEQKYLKKIFRKFYRIPTGDIYNVKGFGLGLFYVKKICDRHHWKINIESELGSGTIISVIFPKLKE